MSLGAVALAGLPEIAAGDDLAALIAARAPALAAGDVVVVAHKVVSKMEGRVRRLRDVAAGAGLPCLITVNGYTREENFDQAVLVVSELGDPGRPPIEVLANRGPARPGDYVGLDDLRDCMRGGSGPGGNRTPTARETDNTGEGDQR